MKRIASSLASGVLVLSLGAACGDDEGSGVTPEPSASTEDPPMPDAAADAESPTTSPEESSSTAEMLVEAGSDLPDAAPTDGMTSDQSSMPPVLVDAGDAGPDSGGALECSVGSAEGVEDNCAALATDRWCDSESASFACSAMAFLRDESIYDAFVSCLDDALEPAGACDDVDTAVGECFAAADATACPVHVDACDVYDDCQEYTVEQCDQLAAKYNDYWIDYASAGFDCANDPAYALGE